MVHKAKKKEKKGAIINFLPLTASLKAECMKNTCKLLHSNVVIISQQYSFASKFITEIWFLIFFFKIYSKNIVCQTLCFLTTYQAAL